MPLATQKNSYGDALEFVAESVEFSEIEAAGEDKPLPSFSMVAYTGGAMTLKDFPHPVVVEFSGLSIAASIPTRMNHDPKAGVGHTQVCKVDGGQLIAVGIISRDTWAARDLAKSGKAGFPWKASIGAKINKAVMIRAGQVVTVNGKQFTGPLIVARQSSLKEISFVDQGADENSSVRIAASATGECAMTFELWLQANGFTEVSEAQKNILQAAWEASESVAAEGAEGDEKKAEAGGSDPAAEIRAAASTECTRIAEIRAACGDKYLTIAAQAIQAGWSKEKTELEVLRAARPKGPAMHTSTIQNTPDILEAAVCMTEKLHTVQAQFNVETLEAADKLYHGRMGLQKFFLEAAWSQGYTGRHFDHDMRGVINAAFSSVDFATLLSNVQNKFLLDAFISIEQVWKMVCSTRSVKDFKATQGTRLYSNSTFDEVGQTGELHYANLSDESFSNQAKTYGIIAGLTRQDLINDDMGALTSMGRMLGRAGALKLNDVFWKAWLDNASFFTAGRKNYLDGAATAFGIDALTAAEQLFMDQEGPDSTAASPKPLGISPSILLVPTSLKTKAENNMLAQEIRDTTASTKFATSNPHAGKWRPVCSAYLSKSGYSGYSTAAWYMLADPQTLSAIEVCFLNGNETPIIETAQAGFDTLGQLYRGYHDFGVTKQDWRAAVKMKGTA